MRWRGTSGNEEEGGEEDVPDRLCSEAVQPGMMHSPDPGPADPDFVHGARDCIKGCLTWASGLWNDAVSPDILVNPQQPPQKEQSGLTRPGEGLHRQWGCVWLQLGNFSGFSLFCWACVVRPKCLSDS